MPMFALKFARRDPTSGTMAGIIKFSGSDPVDVCP
jgi:hypothetical protein